MLTLATAASATTAPCADMTMPAAALKSVGRGFSGQHPGIDLVAPYGSPVRSAAAGTVIYAGSYSNYGNMVDVLHRNGVVTRYAHLSSFAPGVHRGSGVRTGSLLGTVGATGNATGAHLHFEVRINDRAVDPKPALAMAACHRLPTTREPIEVARASTTHWVGWTRWGSPRGSAR